MIVVGCGKAKRTEPARAGDLYTGSLFRAARAYAIASQRPWVILSAVHGILSPEMTLAPYEQKLASDVQSTEAWARRAADEIERRRQDAPAPVEILVGKLYADPLAAELESRGVPTTQPLRRLSLGHRLQKLSRMTDLEYDRRATEAEPPRARSLGGGIRL